MAGKNGLAGFGLFRGAHSNQADDPDMRLPAVHGKFAEVLVERNEDAASRMRSRQDGLIARILGPLADALDVVSML